MSNIYAIYKAISESAFEKLSCDLMEFEILGAK